jgi:hypothetical protein
MYHTNTSDIALQRHEEMLRNAEQWRRATRAIGEQSQPNIFKALRAAIARRSYRINAPLQPRRAQIELDSGVFSIR